MTTSSAAARALPYLRFDRRWQLLRISHQDQSAERCTKIGPVAQTWFAASPLLTL